MSTQRINDTVLCIDSFNRDERAFPETHDFSIDLKQRYEMQAMALGSFEFPNNQYTIEDDWSIFCYDVGLSFVEDASRYISFSFPFHWNISMVPAPYTLLTKDTQAGVYRTITLDTSNTEIANTKYNIDPGDITIYTSHGLSPSSISIFDENIKLVLENKGIKQGNDLMITTSYQIHINHYISDTEWNDEYPEFAFLMVTAANTRTFKNPSQIARHISAYCQNPPSLLPMQYPEDTLQGKLLYFRLTELQKLINRLRFQYDNSAMTMNVSVSLPETDFRNDYDAKDLIGIGSEGQLLANMNIELQNVDQDGTMYFQAQTVGSFPFCNFDPRANVTEVSTRDKLIPSSVRFPAGHYKPEILKDMMSLLMNPNIHHVIPESSTNEPIIFTDSENTDKYVSVGAAFTYHSHGLERYLQKVLDPATNNEYKIEYKNFRFHISRHDSKKFKIRWPEGDEQELRKRLGFPKTETYRRVQIGEVRVFNNLPSFISIFDNFQQQNYMSVEKFTFEVVAKHDETLKVKNDGLHFTVNNATYPLNGDEHDITKFELNGKSLSIPVGALPNETPVVIKLNTGLSVYGYVHSTSSTTEIILFREIEFAISQIQEINCLSTDTVALNLYFPSTITRSVDTEQGIWSSQTVEMRKSWSRLAEIMGFAGGCHSSSTFLPYQEILQSVGQWCFDPPAYILIDLGLPNSSLTTHQRSGDSMFKHMFGKLVLYPPFYEKRHLPIQAISTGVSVISYLNIRLYNPWHQLYQLHKRNWSMTLILSSGQRAAITDST